MPRIRPSRRSSGFAVLRRCYMRIADDKCHPLVGKRVRDGPTGLSHQTPLGTDKGRQQKPVLESVHYQCIRPREKPIGLERRQRSKIGRARHRPRIAES
jgi:hypothetical protein